jgi:predicted ABC-type ATPase
MLEQIRLLAGQGRDFGFETTLSGKSYLRLLTHLKAQAYRIHLYFLWIKNVDIAIERIADRVRRGGHSVPQDVVRRRFKKGMVNLFRLYRPLLDSWVIFDNSSEIPYTIAFEKFGQLQIVDSDLFAELSRNLEAP